MRVVMGLALTVVGAIQAEEATVPTADSPGDARAAVVADTAPEQTRWTRFGGRLYQVVDGLWYDEAGWVWKPITVTTTAYAPTRDQCDGDPGVTATGSNALATYGVAADPRALPYGTVLRIPGYGDAPVDDTGGAMRRSWSQGVLHLDLRIPLRRFDGYQRSEREATRVAMEHGVQRDRVVLMSLGRGVARR